MTTAIAPTSEITLATSTGLAPLRAATVPATTVNLGPSGLKNESGAFVLERSEWLRVQRYVEQGLALPLTQSAMRTAISAGDTDDMTPFSALLSAYQNVAAHCTTWKTDTYPATVNLANDVVHYNTKVPIYYGALTKALNALLSETDPAKIADARKKFVAVADALAKEADAYASRAQIVYDNVKTFADNTSSDKSTLETVKSALNTKYGATSQEVTDLNNELTAQTLVMNAANEEYEQDVIIAATTPTYAWVPVVGLIAAAVVAGVYGDKAVKALERARAARRRIDEIGGILARDAKLMSQVTSAVTGLDSILTSLNAALPIIQKVQGVWSALKSDLGNISKIINDDIKSVPEIIADLGIDEAIAAWGKISAQADAYRVNAYITVTPGGETPAAAPAHALAAPRASALLRGTSSPALGASAGSERLEVSISRPAGAVEIDFALKVRFR